MQDEPVRRATKRAPTLRSILVMVVLLTTALALVVSGALVVLTTTINRATDSMGESVESVRLAEEAEIDLLLHSRARDTVFAQDLEANVRRSIRDANAHVGSEQEALLLAQAAASVDMYMAASRDDTLDPDALRERHAEAFQSLKAFAALNVEQARESRDAVARGNRLANTLGVSAGVVVIVLVGVVIAWLRRRAFQPLFELADAMSRFGRGDRAARADTAGPAEIQEMSERFNELADAVEAQRRSQLALLGGVAHDLRSPLSALSLSIDVLAADAKGPQHKVVDTARRQVSRLERMLGDFLSLAKVEAGELDLVLRLEDLRAIVKEAVDLQRGSASHHLLQLALPAEAVYVRCDTQRVEQIIANLVSNAIKYSPEDAPIEIEVAARQGRATIRITDHGIGISEEDQQALFKPFRRVGGARAIVPGIGLGLWVALRIAEAHGGGIDVSSKPNRGATFTIQLPLVEAAETGLGGEADRGRLSVH